MGVSCKTVSFFLWSVLMVVFFIPATGLCHRVNIFCWVEGNQVKCESRFTPGGPVKSGRVAVYSQQTGEKLLTTTTDQDGKTVFEIPETARKNGWDLKVECDAEMGHRNFWLVKADEFFSGEDKVSRTREQRSEKEMGTTAEEMEKVFSRVLNGQLAPIKRDLAELKVKRISFQDILGGLGYIFGLAGIVFYFLGKKERN